jgi:hypothetical protein
VLEVTSARNWRSTANASFPSICPLRSFHWHCFETGERYGDLGGKWVVEATVAGKPPSGAKPRNHTSLSFLNQVGEG